MKKTRHPAKGKRAIFKKIAWAVIGLLLLLATVIAYDSFFNRSKKVEGTLLQPDKELKGHTKPLWAVRFSPDDNWIASGGVDGNLQIWQKSNAALVHTLKQPMGITTLAFRPDGGAIATGSYDGGIRIWNLATKSIEKEWTAGKGTVWSVVWSADGKRLASGGQDRQVKLWNAATGNLVQAMPGHKLNIWKVRFTPDGKQIISSSFDDTIKIWEAGTGTLARTLAGHSQAVVGLAISADGNTIASASDDKTIKLWETQSGKLIRTLQGGAEHVYAVAFSPDGKRLVSSNRDRSAIGELVQNFLGARFYKSNGVTVRLWDVKTGSLLQTSSAHTDDVMDVTISHDGRWVATASDDNTVRLWRLTP